MKLYQWLTTIFLAGALAAFGAESLESSPWVGWRQGYDCYDRAGAFKQNGELDRAMELYEESKKNFSAVATNFPNWNKAVVEGRIRLCDQEIAKLRKQGARRTAAPTPAPAVPAPNPEVSDDFAPDFEEPAPAPAPRTTRPRNVQRRPSYGNEWESDVGVGRSMIELEAELNQYRQRWRKALQEIDNLQLKLQQAELRSRDVNGLMRDYRQLQDKYDLLAAQYQELKARAGDVGNSEELEAQLMELKMANDEAQRTIRRLNADIAARDEEYGASRREVLTLKEQLQQAQNEAKRLEREVERTKRTGVSTQEVEKLNAKIAEQKTELEKKEKEIGALLTRLAQPGASGNPDDLKEIARLREELAALKAAGSEENDLRSKVSALTAETERLTQQLQESEEHLRQRDKEYQALLTASNQEGSARSLQSAELKTLRQHTADLEADLKSWSQRYAELEKRYRTQRSASMDLPNSMPESARVKRAEEARQNAETELAEVKKQLEEAQKLLKESRDAIIDSKAHALDQEVAKEKLAALQKAYDELKAKWELAQNSSDADVLESLKRIPGLEESLRRYEAENKSLLQELNALKLKVQSGTATAAQPADAPKSAAEMEKIETLLADARAAEARANFEVAIWGYRQVLGRDADNLEASRNLGMLLLARSSFDEAAALLSRAAKQEPANERTWNAWARALIGKRDYDGALNVLQEFGKKNPNGEYRNLKITEALAYSRSGKNKEAEAAFKEVLKLDANNVEAAHELALLLSADEARRKEAGEYYLMVKDHGGEVDPYLEEVLKSVTGTDRATIDFLVKSATDALNSGDYASAEWYVAELAKMASGKSEIRRLEAELLLFTGKPAEALAKLPKEAAERSDVLLRAAVLAANQQAAEAETLLKTLPEGKSALELQPLKAWAKKRAAEKPAEKALMEAIEKAL